MQRAAGLIGLLLLLFGVAARSFPLATPVGVQCPTAQVHTIRVAVKSACGCVIGHVERAPKPGEKGFVQCRCNEGRTAQKSSPPPAPALPHAVTTLTLVFAPVFFVKPPASFASIPEIDCVPSVPPPATV